MLPTEFLPKKMGAVFDGVFPDGVLKTALMHTVDGGWNFGWKSNKRLEEGFSHLNKSFVVAGVKNRLDIYRMIPEPIRPMWDTLRATVLPNFVPVRCYANMMPFGMEGYPHTDSHNASDITAVVYLNPEWHRDWGGETILFDDDGNAQMVVTPKFGRVLLLDATKFHKAAPVSRICAMGRVVLVFKARVE